MTTFVTTFLKLHIFVLFIDAHVAADGIRQIRETVEASSTSDMIDKLLVNYDNRVRPGLGNGREHLNVTVKIYALPWFEMEELRMEYSLTIILIQKWMDERLSFQDRSIKSIMLNGEHMQKVWIPDTYIRNERKSQLHRITYPNQFVTIQPDGMVALEIRTSVTLGCNSAFDNSEEFPFDSHHCMFTMESFKGKDGEIMYHWENELDGEGLELFPASRTTCASFFVSKLTEYQEVVITDHDENNPDEIDNPRWLTPRLSVEILFERAVEPYITTVYIPLMIFTSISILSLGVINAKISSFLNFFNVTYKNFMHLPIAFVNMFMALRFNSQNMIWTTKATALDKYLNMCNLFIICCAVVNIVVIYMGSSKKNDQENIELRDVQPSSIENESHNYFNSGGGSENENLFSRPRTESFITGSNIILSKLILWMKKVPDAVSLFCEFSSWTFAGAFVVANAFYWAKHL